MSVAGLPLFEAHSEPLPKKRRNRHDGDRFWRRVAKSEGCWEWTGAVDHVGYGRFSVGGKHVSAHRMVWRLTHGEPERGLFVLHRCDNRRCVNPGHLFLGTHADNMRDMAAKGRKAPTGGERNGRSRLTEAEVMEIRRLRRGGLQLREIAARMGAPVETVGHAARGYSWAHLPGGLAR